MIYFISLLLVLYLRLFYFIPVHMVPKCCYTIHYILIIMIPYIHPRLHTEEKPVLCCLCGKAFTVVTTILNYSNILSYAYIYCDGMKTYLCAPCGNTYTRDRYPDPHLTSHNEEKPYQLAPKYMISAFTDMTITNSRNMKFGQDVMDIKFRYVIQYILINSNLHIHPIIHTEEKLYPCNICGKDFPHLSAYNFFPKGLISAWVIKHIHIHTDEFLHPIDIDMFIFIFRLYEHMLANLSALSMPFSCTKCDFDHLGFKKGNKSIIIGVTMGKESATLYSMKWS